MRELIVDNFAGGGGASTGIEMALGRSPDYAINHDPAALAMHRANHPETLHLCNSVWKVDPDEIKGPIGLGWFSPDCKHFSKAKGGRPVEKGIRDLAWVVVRWAMRREGGPRIIILENVEEFRTWGPIGDDGKPCPLRKGETFKQWIRELKRHGYKAIEHRELRACDFGAPTIRKRLFLIARRDGKPIIWPKPTHAPAEVNADGIVTKWAKGHGLTLKDLRDLRPWRTAAEIIDWSLPCPSIFATSIEIMGEHGLRAVRPLKPATLARIAKGVHRYVLSAANPFIVSLTHHGGDRTESISDPMMTVTGANRGEKAVVIPTLVQTGYGERCGQAPRVPGLDKPLGTAVAGGVKHALVTPIIAGVGGRMGQTEPRSGDVPLQTLTAKADSVVLTPLLARTAHGEVDKNGKRRGKGSHTLEEPFSTVLASPDHALIAPHLTKFRANSIGSGMDEPAPTVTANSYIKKPGGAAPIGVVAPHLMTMRNAQKPFNGADEPTHTITAGGAHLQAVAGFLAQHNIDGRTGEGNPGRSADEPLSTVLQSGSHQGVVAAHLVREFGTAVGSSLDDPAKTVMADGGGGKSQLSASFLTKYYGTGEGQDLQEPAHTVTSKDRLGLVEVLAAMPPFGPEHYERARAVADLLRNHGFWDDREFVTFDLHGVTVVLTDIGMRMLVPRELFRAQGFPEIYEIETGIFPVERETDGVRWTEYERRPISKTDQVAKCGNSVSPPMACALVTANCGDLAEIAEAAE
ncbi:hypothetical protein AFEL58S_02065 [Afipia felis]